MSTTPSVPSDPQAAPSAASDPQQVVARDSAHVSAAASMPEPTSGATPAQAPPPSRYSLGSMPNMVRSLLVIVALMALVIFMVPRVNSLSGPPVDVKSRGLEVVRDTGWPIVMPVDLPKGWQATSVRFVRTTGGAMTWLAGYQAPSGNYVSVEQTKDASNAWVDAEVNRATKLGTVSIDGKAWIKYERGSKTQNSLVHRPDTSGELTTLVTGTGTFEELTDFIGHLRPVTP